MPKGCKKQCNARKKEEVAANCPEHELNPGMNGNVELNLAACKLPYQEKNKECKATCKTRRRQKRKRCKKQCNAAKKREVADNCPSS